jgi:hypothetical protein
MKKYVSIALVLALVPAFSVAATTSDSLLLNAKTATVFVANFDADGDFTGWGSGFYVDEGIIVTNKHVIEGGKYYRVYATRNDRVDLDCSKELSRADVKINLDNDVAYMRAYVDCPHGVVQFADADPPLGAPVSVIGYPVRDTFDESLNTSVTTGIVTHETDDGWLSTDAYLQSGNSGGPVVTDGKVVGVAVAKGMDQDGNFVEGYFVPTSTILAGLLYANNSTFGYTPQSQQNNPAYSSGAKPYGKQGDPFDPPRVTVNATNGDCRQSLGDGGEATGAGGCRCKGSYHKADSGDVCLPGDTTVLALPTQMSSSSFSSRSRGSSSSRSSSSSSSSMSSASSRPLSLKERIALRRGFRLAKYAARASSRMAKRSSLSSQAR